MTHPTPQLAQGLYDPRYEHDACGVALVARLDDKPTHEVVEQGLLALENLEHRGAAGADKHTGDGAGMLVQMPDRFLRSAVDFLLPPRGEYGVAMCFFPRDEARREKLEALMERTCASRARSSSAGATCRSTRRTSARRPTPRARTSASSSSPPARASPTTRTPSSASSTSIRRICELAAGPDFYIASMSSRTLVYKGMLIAHQVRQGFYPRPPGRALRQRDGARALALLDEHLPELGARPPVPRDRPQRRDQHAHGQRQLDARPRVADALGAVRRRPAQGPARRPPRGQRQRHLRQTSSSCSCSPVARCRTRS